MQGRLALIRQPLFLRLSEFDLSLPDCSFISAVIIAKG
jgi:hypothetical protein